MPGFWIDRSGLRIFRMLKKHHQPVFFNLF